MKYIIMFAIIIQFVNANSKDLNLSDKFNFLDKKLNMTNLKDNELLLLINNLSSIQYQKQFLELNNLAMNIDTNVQVLKSRVDTQKNVYEVIVKYQLNRFKILLDAQQKKFDTTLKAQQDKYEVELKQQIKLFGIISIIVAIIGWLGYNNIRKLIVKSIEEEIKKNHADVTKKELFKLSENNEFIDNIRSKANNMTPTLKMN